MENKGLTPFMLGKFHQKLGQTTEDMVLKHLDEIEAKGYKLNYAEQGSHSGDKIPSPGGGHYVPDAILEWADEVVTLENKYSLPKTTGKRLDDTARQLRALDSNTIDPRSGKPVAGKILIVHRMPTAKQLGLLKKAAPEVELIEASLGMHKAQSNLIQLVLFFL